MNTVLAIQGPGSAERCSDHSLLMFHILPILGKIGDRKSQGDAPFPQPRFCMDARKPSNPTSTINTAVRPDCTHICGQGSPAVELGGCKGLEANGPWRRGRWVAISISKHALGGLSSEGHSVTHLPAQDHRQQSGKKEQSRSWMMSAPPQQPR